MLNGGFKKTDAIPALQAVERQEQLRLEHLRSFFAERNFSESLLDLITTLSSSTAVVMLLIGPLETMGDCRDRTSGFGRVVRWIPCQKKYVVEQQDRDDDDDDDGEEDEEKEDEKKEEDDDGEGGEDGEDKEDEGKRNNGIFVQWTVLDGFTWKRRLMKLQAKDPVDSLVVVPSDRRYNEYPVPFGHFVNLAPLANISVIFAMPELDGRLVMPETIIFFRAIRADECNHLAAYHWKATWLTSTTTSTTTTTTSTTSTSTSTSTSTMTKTTTILREKSDFEPLQTAAFVLLRRES